MNEAPTADGGPGFLAFLAFFILAIALWFLMRNMNARMRRMSYRQQAAHRGKDDPQAGPGEVDLEDDGPVTAATGSAGDDPASGPVDEASGPDDVGQAGDRDDTGGRARPALSDPSAAQ